MNYFGFTLRVSQNGFTRLWEFTVELDDVDLVQHGGGGATEADTLLIAKAWVDGYRKAKGIDGA